MDKPMDVYDNYLHYQGMRWQQYAVVDLSLLKNVALCPRVWRSMEVSCGVHKNYDWSALANCFF